MPAPTAAMSTAIANTFCLVKLWNAMPTISRSKPPEFKPIVLYIPVCIGLFQVSKIQKLLKNYPLQKKRHKQLKTSLVPICI